MLKNYLLESNAKVSKIAISLIGTNSFKFDPLPFIHLNAKQYYHGDTIYGRICIPMNESPLSSIMTINENVFTGYRFIQTIDSSFSPINIDVNYMKSISNDTSFQVYVQYGKKL